MSVTCFTTWYIPHFAVFLQISLFISLNVQFWLGLCSQNECGVYFFAKTLWSMLLALSALCFLILCLMTQSDGNTEHWETMYLFIHILWWRLVIDFPWTLSCVSGFLLPGNVCKSNWVRQLTDFWGLLRNSNKKLSAFSKTNNYSWYTNLR